MINIPDTDRVRLRPPPNVIPIQFGIPWRITTPSVYRYEDEKWINEFFETGKLRLSTFAKFATYPDEIRGDKNEGFGISYGETTSGQSVIVVQKQGISAAILCCSHKLNKNLMKDFSRDSAFEIMNTTQFSLEIARQLPGFNGGLEGSCIYRTERSITRAINLNLNEYRRNDGTMDMQMLPVAGGALGGEELILLKQKRHETQREYRLVWTLDSIMGDSVDIFVPRARQYCRRIDPDDWTN